MKKILIIAYGNPYRNDDSVAHYIANEIQRWANEKKIKNITIITAYQLDLDMTEEISEADKVLFIDAHVTDYSPSVVINVVKPKQTTGFTTHVFTPADLLDLSNKLYNKQPTGMIVSVPGFNFDMGETLTDETKRQADFAVKKIKEIIS